MTDYTLKFPDEETANEVLEPFIATHAIDIIGTIYKPMGEDGEYPTIAKIDGWHVNVRGAESPELKPYIIEVKTPIRVWA